MAPQIPFVDLESQYNSIKSEIHDKIIEILDSRAFIQGRFVEEFENDFASMHGSQFALGCSNGTSAICLALKSLGIGAGDEVITTAHTFIATGEAICHVGATPVFVDIDPDAYNMNPECVEKAITDKTKAVIPVHLYGNPCKMDEIMDIARRHGLFVVEDCAQAHFAKYDGKHVGTFGDMGTFSFYPGKNLGAYGDAGCVITQNEKYAVQLKKLRDHGRLSKYEHDIIGYNFRMDGLQAGVLQVKLKYIEAWNKARLENAFYYDEKFNAVSVKVIQSYDTSQPVYHLYVIQTENRDKVMDHLKSKGIACGIHYPLPLHLQPAFQYLKYSKGDLSCTEYAADRILSLPMCPELTKEQIDYICAEVEHAI
jgi:dTDP-4-amino-4,6-dideoxygalactose transaminase